MAGLSSDPGLELHLSSPLISVMHFFSVDECPVTLLGHHDVLSSSVKHNTKQCYSS